MAASKTGVWRCTRGFSYPGKQGGMVTVPAGAVVPHDVPAEVMKGREHLFEDLTAPREAATVVESASKAPGEKRTAVKK